MQRVAPWAMRSPPCAARAGRNSPGRMTFNGNTAERATLLNRLYGGLHRRIGQLPTPELFSFYADPCVFMASSNRSLSLVLTSSRLKGLRRTTMSSGIRASISESRYPVMTRIGM